MKKIVLLTLFALAVSACQCGNGQPAADPSAPAAPAAPAASQTAEKPAGPASPLDPKRELTEEQKEKIEQINQKLKERIDSILEKAVEDGQLDSAQLKQLKEMAE